MQEDVLVAHLHDLSHIKRTVDVISDGDKFATDKRLAIMWVELSIRVGLWFLGVIAAHVRNDALIASFCGIFDHGVSCGTKTLQNRAGATPGSHVFGVWPVDPSLAVEIGWAVLKFLLCRQQKTWY